jgi:ABC-type enterochelin transport system substrate-binding protein
VQASFGTREKAKKMILCLKNLEKQKKRKEKKKKKGMTMQLTDGGVFCWLYGRNQRRVWSYRTLRVGYWRRLVGLACGNHLGHSR